MKTLVFKRIFITGAGGFVGSHLIPALKEAAPDSELFLLARDHKPGYVQGDIADTASMDHVLSQTKPDLIIHLAAQSSVVAQAAETWKINAGGAIALAQAIARHAPTATVLNISSSEVYGHSFLSGPVNEETPPQPMSVYGRSKLASESIFSDVLSSDNRLIHARPFNHTGPGQDERFVVPSFAARIARIEKHPQMNPLTVGNLESRRDFLDVRDVVRAYRLLLAQADTLPMRSIFNICSGRSLPIRDMLDMLRSMAKQPIDVAQDPARMRASDIPSAEGDYSRLHQQTGWHPQIAFQQTLDEMLADFRTL